VIFGKRGKDIGPVFREYVFEGERFRTCEIPEDQIIDCLEDIARQQFGGGISLPSMDLKRGNRTTVTLTWNVSAPDDPTRSPESD
jgi:hypothetical protein